MPTIKVTTKQPSRIKYNIIVQKDLAKEISKHLKKLDIGRKYAIITDSVVDKLFARTLKAKLTKAKIKSEILTFPKGEKSKTLKTVEQLHEKMVAKKFDRLDAVIALGGGVVGDIAGFVASTYMRGIPYIQIPTTLMAMVDSAIGGKNGVDLPKGGKNLVGTITQPQAVLIDPNYIKKLPQTQIRSGLAEIIKYGVILDPKLFKFIERNLEKILKNDPETLEYLIIRSVKSKAFIVSHDEKEKGLRVVLNYGHTYGHALEKLSNYRLLHGYAISIGMVLANKMAVKLGFLKKKHADRIKKLLKDAGLPITTIKKPTLKDCLSDKKKSGDYIKFILPKKIGKVIVYNKRWK